MDINFELYKIFYHAAVSSSFSEAAKRLYISQSAVSQAIAGLEDKTGCRLFIRKSRSIKLTAEGEVLLKHIEQAYNFIKTGEAKLQEMQDMDSGEIRIGVSDTVCRYFLLPVLQKFTSAYPHIKIRVINRTSSQIIEILKNGHIDFGIVTLPIEDKNIEIAPYSDAEDIFVASSRYGYLKNRSISLKELAGLPLLLLQKDSATRRNLDAFFVSNSISIIPEIELESIELLVEFARIGLGIAHVLKESAAAHIKSGELFQVDITEKMTRRPMGIAMLKNMPQSQATNRFLHLLSLPSKDIQ
jgi:DNA-binding transcriptional LysR family regulator